MPTPSEECSDHISDSKVYRIIDENRLDTERFGIEDYVKSIKVCDRVSMDLCG